MPQTLMYWAAQRECQNAALLQMMETAVEQASAKPVLVYRNPKKTLADAVDNLLGFAEEVRLTVPPPEGVEMVEISAIPRFPRCYGWLKFNAAEVFPKMP